MAEPSQSQKIPLIFFRSEGGSEPVREWLKGLPEAERQAIGKDLLRGKSERTCRRKGQRVS